MIPAWPITLLISAWFMFIAPLLSGPYLLADKFELKGVANQVRSVHLERRLIDAMTFMQKVSPVRAKGGGNSAPPLKNVLMGGGRSAALTASAEMRLREGEHAKTTSLCYRMPPPPPPHMHAKYRQIGRSLPCLRKTCLRQTTKSRTRSDPARPLARAVCETVKVWLSRAFGYQFMIKFLRRRIARGIEATVREADRVGESSGLF